MLGMGKLFKVVLVLMVIAGVLIAGKNVLVKIIVEKGVKAATGLSLKIKKLDISIVSSHVGITDLRLLNPDGFPAGTMFYASEIFIDYHLRDMLKGKVHLEDLRLNFDQLIIVKNAEGQLNLAALKPKAKSGSKNLVKKNTGEDTKKEAPQIQIDHLVLKIGKVTYKDYSGGGEPSVREFNVNISQELTDVTDVRKLLGLVASRAIAQSALNVPFDFTAGILKDVSSAPKQVVDTLKNTANILKEKIKLPFGSN